MQNSSLIFITDELLARRPAEIPRVDTRQDDILLSGRRDPARLGDQIGDRHIPAAAAGVVDRTGICGTIELPFCFIRIKISL